MKIALRPDTTPGQLCRTARRARGLTLVEVARRLGRSIGWLSLAERGLCPLTPEDASALLAAIGVTIISPQESQRPTPRPKGKV